MMRRKIGVYCKIIKNLSKGVCVWVIFHVFGCCWCCLNVTPTTTTIVGGRSIDPFYQYQQCVCCWIRSVSTLFGLCCVPNNEQQVVDFLVLIVLLTPNHLNRRGKKIKKAEKFRNGFFFLGKTVKMNHLWDVCASLTQQSISTNGYNWNFELSSKPNQRLASRITMRNMMRKPQSWFGEMFLWHSATATHIHEYCIGYRQRHWPYCATHCSQNVNDARSSSICFFFLILKSYPNPIHG